MSLMAPEKKTEEKKVATIEIGTRYIKLNAAYNHQLALKTNKHFEEASGLKVCVASKKYTIYVFLWVAQEKYFLASPDS